YRCRSICCQRRTRSGCGSVVGLDRTAGWPWYTMLCTRSPPSPGTYKFALVTPLTVHLRIGLLLGNALLPLLYLRRRDRALEISAFHCLWLGWLGTLVAIAHRTHAGVLHVL